MRVGIGIVFIAMPIMLAPMLVALQLKIATVFGAFLDPVADKIM